MDASTGDGASTARRLAAAADKTQLESLAGGARPSAAARGAGYRLTEVVQAGNSFGEEVIGGGGVRGSWAVSRDGCEVVVLSKSML